MTIMHTCVCCGKEYEACDYCDEHKLSAQRWRTICCSPECYQGYVVYTEYRAGRMALHDAAMRLSELGIETIGKIKSVSAIIADKAYASKRTRSRKATALKTDSE